MMILLKTITIVSLCFFVDVTKSIDFNGTCEETESKSVPAFTQWPFRMDCSHLKTSWERDSRHSTGDTYQCEIQNADTSVTRTEGIFELIAMNSTTTYKAILVINSKICISSNIEVDLRPFPNESCRVYEDRQFISGDVRFQQGQMKKSAIIRCIPPEGSPTIIPEGVSVDEFTTRWNLDCDAYKVDEAYRNNGHNTRDPEGYPDQLNRYGIDFYDAGNYTCEVTYNGRTLRVVTTSFCVKQSEDFTKPTMTCTTVETEPQGGTATLKCQGQVAIGKLYPGDLTLEWEKAGNVLCQNEVYNKTEPGLISEKQSCVANGNNGTIECVKHVIPQVTEIQKGRRIVEMLFEIRDLESDDFGDYIATLRYKGSQEVSWTITLNEDKTLFYQRLVIYLSAVFAVLIFLMVVFILVKRFVIYIKICYKRSCLWKYDRDDKNFVAYLSYYYENEMEEKSLKSTQRIVYGIQEQLESMNYSFYDEQRNGDSAVRVERITNLVENCHRMIIVVTPQYLEDRWMRFHAELGFHGLLESRMGLVFILVPHVKKLLIQKAKKDRVWERVLIALKASRVIHYSETMSADRLKRHIEFAMPKLLRENSVSSDSESISSPDFMRSMSQNTECVIIDSSPDIIYKDGVLKSSYSKNNLQ